MTAASASSTHPLWRQMVDRRLTGGFRVALETLLEAERDQLALWIPVCLGVGIALWFALPDQTGWEAVALSLAGLAMAMSAIGRAGRAARVLTIAAFLIGAGVLLSWWRAEHIAAPVLSRAAVVQMRAEVEAAEPLVARDLVRLVVYPINATDGRGRSIVVPPRLRINLTTSEAGDISAGALIRLRARLMPPPGPAVPGAYDFARVAWFAGIGATGRGFAPVQIERRGGGGGADIRHALSRHIAARLPGSAGGIAVALATGDTGRITEDDADAMRRAGLAHLLSVSGLHITAVVGAAMFLVLRLLALSPWAALHLRLPIVAAVAGSLAAIGYTWLTGAHVPTIRSCVAALLVLAALAMGREAITLRLVATGAFIVLLVRPEALVGASFQLSFAAITAIVALHELPWVKRTFSAQQEAWSRRMVRQAGSLLLTGVVVEVALMPIAIYHFHKAGLYGALVNIVAIPLTTFVIMPLEAMALLLDAVGLGAPVWWLGGSSLRLLLAMARLVAAAPGSVAALPAMPGGAFAAMMGGGLWLALWRTRWRLTGIAPILLGAAWALMTPVPDLLVTGDGRHVAIRTEDGTLALLRDRTGDYTRGLLSEGAGITNEPVLLAEQSDARCSRDLCAVERRVMGRHWRILATRSAYLVPVDALIVACAHADIVVSERLLPRGCRPRWLRLDRSVLAETGGVSIALASGSVRTVLHPGDRHPWRIPPLVGPVSRSGAAVRRAYPGRAPAREHSAADHRRGWRGRGEPSRLHAGNI